MALSPLAKSGGGDDHGGMENRLQRLEDDMREVKVDLKALRTDVNDLKKDVIGLRVDMGELKGRMSAVEGRLSLLPTTWQMFTFMMSMMAGVFAIVRFGSPH